MPEYPAAALTVGSATHAIASSGVSEDAIVLLGFTPNTGASIGHAPNSVSVPLRVSKNTIKVATATHADIADTKHAYLTTLNEIRGIVALVDADNSGTAEAEDADICCLLPICYFRSVKISTEPDWSLSVDSDHAGAKSHAL
jgi:hypothetical protein